MELKKTSRLVVPKGADKKTVEKICTGLFGRATRAKVSPKNPPGV